MSNLDIVRAWKDEEYRNSLSEEALAQLPEHPAGVIELQDEELLKATGGEAAKTSPAYTAGCCQSTGGFTWTCAICAGYSAAELGIITSWPCC